MLDQNAQLLQLSFERTSHQHTYSPPYNNDDDNSSTPPAPRVPLRELGDVQDGPVDEHPALAVQHLGNGGAPPYCITPDRAVRDDKWQAEVGVEADVEEEEKARGSGAVVGGAGRRVRPATSLGF